MKNVKHKLFLQWLIVATLIVFGLGSASYFGLVGLVIINDISYISATILGMFLIITAIFGVITYRTSDDIDLSVKTEDIIKGMPSEELCYRVDNERVFVGNQQLPNCSLTQHIKRLIKKSENNPQGKLNQALLLEEYGESLHYKGAIGWIVSQKAINLGLLGTAIGFAVALTAFFGIASFEAVVIKGILADVSVGMSVALYTTITALVASIPTKIQAHLLEYGNNQLVSRAVRLTEVYVVPVLERPINVVKKSSKK